MKLSVFLVGFAATTVVVWLFVFLDEVQARPAMARAPHAAVQYSVVQTRSGQRLVLRGLDAG